MSCLLLSRPCWAMRLHLLCAVISVVECVAWTGQVEGSMLWTGLVWVTEAAESCCIHALVLIHVGGLQAFMASVPKPKCIKNFQLA